MDASPRTPKKTESFAGVCILLLLAGIGVAVYQAQFDFNRAVLTARSIQPDNGARIGGGSSARVPPLVPVPGDLAVLTPPERFDAAALSDKIDGKAELYLSAGFQQLNSQRFSLAGDSDRWLEMYVYEMKGAENAYAVFSGQRREDARPLDLARYAYRTANAVYLVHGPYYVEIIAAQPLEAFGAAAVRLARNFVAANPVAAAALSPADLFPLENRVPNTVTLLAENAFGFERLNNVYTALYRIDGAEATGFVSRRAGPAEARALAAGYQDFLTRFGGRTVPSALQLENGWMVEIFGVYELVFTHGPILAGVHEAATAELARNLARELSRVLAVRAGKAVE